MPSLEHPAPTLTAAGPGTEGLATESTVFGLDVRATLPLPSLACSRALGTGRTLTLSAIDAGAARAAWSREVATICSQRGPDDAPLFLIEACPTAGYRIWGRGRGSYLLSGDGRRLRCTFEGAPRHRWERFLVGQVLPFAALLSGLEIFHASAVVLDGAAIAFVGPSGAGKTSVALAACRRGARFLADDVLALEALEPALMAHPGAPLAGVDRAEERRLREARRPLTNEVLSTDARERLVRVQGSEMPVALRALFFLDRRSSRAGDLCFAPSGDARMLLASTFNLVLAEPRRMRGLLDVCAAVARCRVERIAVPPGIDPDALAGAVIARLSGSQ